MESAANAAGDSVATAAARTAGFNTLFPLATNIFIAFSKIVWKVV